MIVTKITIHYHLEVRRIHKALRSDSCSNPRRPLEECLAHVSPRCLTTTPSATLTIIHLQAAMSIPTANRGIRIRSSSAATLAMKTQSSLGSARRETVCLGDAQSPSPFAQCVDVMTGYGYDDPGMFADIERSMRPRERSVQARVNQEAYSGYGRPRGLMDAPPEDGPSSQWRRRRDYMIDPALRSSSGCSHSEPFFLRSEREFPRQIHQSIEQPGYRDAWNSGVSFHPIRRPSPSITSGIRPTLRADRPGIMPRKLRLPGTPMGDPRANVLLGLRAPRYLEGRGTPMPGMGDPYDGRR